MRAGVRALAEVALVHGLLGWLYVAAWAAARPGDLSAPVTSLLTLRRDTFGALAFAASAAAAFALQTGRGRPGQSLVPRCPVRSGTVDAALRTVVGYALLVWAYLCVNSLTHPETIGRRLTHFAPLPTEGATAVACYLSSALALFALRVRAARRAGRVGSGG
jgi:hypothetical protein